MEDEKKEKIPASHLRIEKLSPAHTNILSNLESYEPELVNFLVEDALDQQNKMLSITYLWFIKGTNDFVGYITLLADKISLDAPLKEEFRKMGITYKSLPAMKIGRLCVDNKFIRKGIGKLMVEFGIYHAKKICESVGCRFITLDAKRNEDKNKDSLHFYRRMGFEILKIRQKGTTPMYKDISKITEYINKQ